MNPLGDDSSSPRLGWQLVASTNGESQDAYQVQVTMASDETSGAGLVWDSGRVTSSDQVDVAYAGPALRSATRYQWQVRAWDAFGQVSAWSAPAWWETGLGSGTAGWSGAQWISADPRSNAPLLRKEFTLAKPIESARAYIFGLGWDELRVNGAKVGTRVLTPANTQYTQTDLYDTYDITSDMHQGANAVGIWLGRGYGPTYSPYGWRWLGPKQATAKIAVRFRDGTATTIVTDTSWRWSDGPILSNDIYNGEMYDARLEQAGWDTPGFDAAGWQATRVTSAPSGTLSATTPPPVRVVQTLAPVKLTQPRPGVYVFDVGQNIAGWARLRVAGPAGTRVQLRYSEDIGSSGMIDPLTNRNALATDVYILAAMGTSVQTYEPRFTYHGFRFVEVTGYPGAPNVGSLDGRVVHADVTADGLFHSSDPLLNQIHADAQSTMLNNSMSIPTDNPVRDERTPVPMDVQAYSAAAAIDFGMENFYGNYLADLAGRGLGSSNYFTSGGTPDMNGTPVPLAWTLYLQYGDISRLRILYPALKAYVDSLNSIAPAGIQPDKGFGDWCPPPHGGGSGLGGPNVAGYSSCLSERSLVNTALYYRDADLIARMANVLGESGDAASYATLATSIADAFNRHFGDAADDGYGDGRQATSAIPLAFGLVPAAHQVAVADRLASTTRDTNGGHLDTGIFGTPSLVDALSVSGWADAAFGVLEQRTYPSFGYQISLGATTTWEEWPYQTSMETHDHAMFAGVDASLYADFGGITALSGGYGHIRIRPSIPAGLGSVESAENTVRGLVGSRWTNDATRLRLTVQIPVNAVAEIDVPWKGKDVSEIDVPAGASFLGADGTDARYSVSSGTYIFSVTSAAHNAGLDLPVTAASVIGLAVLVLALGFRRRQQRSG